MSKHHFYPVRIRDGRTASGYEVLFDTPQDLLRALGQISRILKAAEDFLAEEGCGPAWHAGLEFAAVNAQQGSQNKMRTGLALRLQGPENAAPQEIETRVYAMSRQVAETLMEIGAACDDPVSTDETLLSAYPSIQVEAPEARQAVTALVKDYDACMAGSGKVLFSGKLPSCGPAAAAEILERIRQHAGSGVSLLVMRERPLQAQVPAGIRSQECLAQLQALADQPPLGVRLTIWEVAERPRLAFAEAPTPVADAAVRALVMYRMPLRRLRLDWPALEEHLVHDPWAMEEPLLRMLGRMPLSRMALLATEEEVAGLFAEKAEKKASEQFAAPPWTKAPSLMAQAQTLNDPAISASARQMEETRTLDAFENRAAELLERLSAHLLHTLDERGVQVIRDMRVQIGAMVGDYEEEHARFLEEMNLLRQDVRSSRADVAQLQADVTEKNSCVSALLSEKMENLAEQFREGQLELQERIDKLDAEVRGKLSDIGERMTALAQKTDNPALLLEALRKEAEKLALDLRFSEAELKGLGVETEEELTQTCHLPPKTVQLLKTALALARMGLDARDETVPLMPFLVPLGSVYEQLMRLFFAPAFQAGEEATLSKLPEVMGEARLSAFDDNRLIRAKTYASHALIGGKKQDDMFWYIWFVTMKPVRFARNKVHANRGHVSREELQRVYDVLVQPNVEAKLAAIAYAIRHTRENGEGIPSYVDYQAMGRQIRQRDADFGVSLLRFIMDLRDAAWE